MSFLILIDTCEGIPSDYSSSRHTLVPLMACYFIICAEIFHRIFLLNSEGFIEQDTNENVSFQLADLQLDRGWKQMKQ